MARRIGSKPYDTGADKAPQFESEIKTLQKEHVEIMLPFLSDKTTEDIFHEMIAICYEAEGANHKVRCAKAKREIIEYLKAQKKEKQTLYNEHRNISFNQSYG